jgi:hypothetical protein
MFQPRQDEESTVIDNARALQNHHAVARSDYHRLLCHVIFTMLLVALVVVETWYLFAPSAL